MTVQAMSRLEHTSPLPLVIGLDMQPAFEALQLTCCDHSR